MIPLRARRLVYWVAFAVAVTASVPALSASHALIMAIDAYEGPSPLPGVAYDVPLAVDIAKRMGVPAENMVVKRNQELTLDGIRTSLKELLARVAPQDHVFVYYSGHGARVNNPRSPTGCTEALVSVNGQLLLDLELAEWVSAMSKKADRFVFMNDSCFAGGVITRSVQNPKFQAKTHRVPNAEDCDDAVNIKAKVDQPREPAAEIPDSIRAMFRRPDTPIGPSTMYMAAANDDEIAFAGPRGSTATLAWVACLSAADPGMIPTAEQLRACSQNLLDRDTSFPPQTIVVLGNSGLPVVFGTDRR